MSPAIEIENLNKSYGDLQALKDVNLTIDQGEFFGLLGPNGAGKSTLIGILGGLKHKDSGSVTVLGNDVIKDYRATKRSLGIVPQEVVFDAYFDVRETLEIQSGYFGLKNNDQKIEEVLTALGLDDKQEMNIRELSGGMKRRLLIAKALVHDPEIVVLDEPTAGVDVELRKSLWQYVRKLNNQGKTIILTTHYLEEAEELCDRIAILDEGKIAAVDSKENLIKSIDKKVVEVSFKAGNLAEDKLAPYKYELNRESGDLKLEIKRSNVGQVIDLLAELEFEIEDIEVKSAKLEDVFMKLTRLGGGDN